MNRSWFFLFAVVAIALIPPSSSRSQEAVNDTAMIREIYVPLESLDTLLGADLNRVFLSRVEYEALKDSAEQEPESRLPLQYALLSANYQASVRDGRAIMRGELVIDVLGDALQAIPLEFAEVGIRIATLDDAPAKLAKDDNGNVQLFVQGKGKHALSVEMTMPVAVDAAQQTLRFGVPTAPSSRLSLDVPGNVEIKTGASIVERELDEALNLTRFQIVPTAGPMSITMSLNNRKTREQTTIMARGVVVAEITQAYERLHGAVSMAIVNGATDELRFVVDDDLDVDSVSCDLLSRWEIQTIDGQKQLLVKLRVPTTERLVVNVRMDRGRPRLQDWKLPTFEPLDVAGYTAVVGLVAEDRLRVSEIQPDSLYTIDTGVLVEATAENLFAAEPGAPRVNAIAAFYATSAKYSLAAQLNVPTPGLFVNASSLLIVSDRGITVSGGLSLTPEHEKLFSFDFLIPPNWNLLWVRDGVDSDLKFDRYQAPDGTRIRVSLPRGIANDTTQTVWFRAEWMPPTWLSDWQTQAIELPAFPVIDARIHQGIVAVQLEDDFLATPTSTENLVLISESEKAKHKLENIPTSLAYQYDALDWTATVEVRRITPRQTARVLSFVRVKTESFDVHIELIYLITQARTRTLQFSLPDSTPREITVGALDGVRIKDTSNALIDGRRQWTVELADRRSGSVRLTIDFVQPLESQQPTDVTLPIARAESVQYQTGAIALEGHPELETTVKQSPRTIDVGELVDAQYQVGKRLIGVYGYVADDDSVVIDLARRPIHALPSTLVQRAELITQVSAQGRCQTAARFQLRTKATFLETRLPDEAALWSVMLDGKPALPQRIGARVLIAIPPSTANPLRDLQLVYETPTAAIGLRGEVDVDAPALFERDDQGGQGDPIPVADLQWTLHLPEGYRLTRADGRDLVTDARASSSVFVDTLAMLGGGSHTRWLPAMQSAREASPDDRVAVWDVVGESLGMPSSGRLDGNQLPPRAEAEEMMMMDGMMMNGLSDREAATKSMPAAKTETPQQPSEGSRSSGRASSAPAPVPPAADEPRKPAVVAGQPWALEGVRSLAINLARDGAGQTVDLSGLGNQTVTRLTIVNLGRFRWIGMLVGLLVFLLGLTRRTWSSRTRYFFVVGLVAALMGPLTGAQVELQSTQQAILVAGVVLLTYYVLAAFFHSAANRFLKDTYPQDETTTDTARGARAITSWLGFFLATAFASQPAFAQQDPFGQGPQSISSISQLKAILDSLENVRNPPRKPVKIPDDAIVIPYDSDRSALESADAERLLVPYETYQRLWELAHPDQKLQLDAPPAAYAWSDVGYETTLDRSGSMQIIGRLRLEQFVDGDLVVPFNLEGCVIENATLDGEPAKLKLIRPTVNPQQAGSPQAVSQQAEATSVAPSGLVMLHTTGKGSKELELRLVMKLEKSGGWQIVGGRLPSAPACSLSLTVEQANTELRLSGVTDRTSYLTTEPNEQLETALAIDGLFTIRWRDQISEASIDQGLTAASKAIFDVREDAMRLVWQAEFEFRRGRRESLRVIIPSDYLVEKVLGDNIRGWTTQSTTAGRQLDVELLKQAVERESMTVILSKQNAVRSGESVTVAVPNPVVPDAMLQQGRFTLRRSALLELRAGQSTGLARIDVPDETQWFSAIDESGPLPMKNYQAYHFSQSQFELPLQVSVIPTKKSVAVQSLVKMSERDTKYEARLIVTAADRPIYRLRIRLPADLEIEPPAAPGAYQWSILEDELGRVLEIQMANGQLGQFSIVIEGELPAVAGQAQAGAPASLNLPKLNVLDTDQQSGAIVVQIDPAYDVRATNLQQCDVALLNTVNHWLSGEQQQLARTVIRYDAAGYDGQLSVTPKTPIVRSITVTNVKVTDRAVEETIYIEATISAAGISEFSFLLPSTLSAARIDAPLIRQKTVIPINDTEGAPLRVTLQLQDSIMGRFAVMVQHDRLLGQGPQSVPVPQIETGETRSRFLTLENASRDELLTGEIISVESLDRIELAKEAKLVRLGGPSSMVFRVQELRAETDPPRLTYQTKSREIVETSGARIGLAKTLLVVDQWGAYRGKQEYRVENRTEPFLEVAMPERSRLWTVQVAGENVKPSSSADATIRIPLIKTAEGELDYPVILKYGGQLDRPGGIREIRFPLIETVNINVQLSQVRLRLPDNLRWFRFDGTMGQVQDESDLQAGWLSFRTRQILELTQLLNSKQGRYAKVRAQYNLKQLESSVTRQNSEFAGQVGVRKGTRFRQQLEDNAFALDQAKQQIAEFETLNEGETVDFDNRDALGELFGSQSNGRARNVASSLGSNFSQQDGLKAVPAEDRQTEESENRFDTQWLYGNNLSVKKSDSKVQTRIGNTTAAVEKRPKEIAPKKGALIPPVQQQQSGQVVQAERHDDRYAQQQIAGDYRAQAERYRERLQEGRGQNAAEGMLGFAMDDKSTAQQNSLDDLFGEQAAEPDAALSGTATFVAPGTDDPSIAGQASRGGRGIESGRGGARGGFGQASDESDDSPQPPAPARAGFLASLEVELPVRGTEYLFTTTGGDLTLTARSIDATSIERLTRCLVMLAIAAIVFVVYRILAARLRTTSPRLKTTAAVLVGILGVTSLVTGVFPIYGLLALLGAISLGLSNGQVSRAAA